MITRIVKWWHDLRRRRKENREALEIITALRRRGHFAPYTVSIGHHLAEPRSQKKKIANYVEWRAVMKNGRPYRRLLRCPYCGGRTRLSVKHPCRRAKKTFIIHRAGFYQNIAPPLRHRTDTHE